MKRWPQVALGIGITAFLAGIILIILFRTMKSIWPVEGRVTSKFGNRTHPVTGVASFHNGIDIAVPVGTPVKAPMRGTVISTGSHPTGGLQMVLQHPNGWRTGYAHLSQYVAKVGEEVVQGETIALSGNTGASTGPHLHFTITSAPPVASKVDPLQHLPKLA